MNMRRLDVLYGVVFLAAAAFLYWVAVDTGVPARRISSDPMWYPKVLLVLMLACALWLVVRGLLSRRDGPAGALQWRPLAVTAVLCSGAILLFVQIGFVLMSLILVPALGWGLGYRRPWAVALTTIGFTAAVWSGFHFGLGITPPPPELLALQ